jgi:hypothetical protein
VVGSIIVFTAVILVAGKPLISACLRMIASSLARYTQKVLLSAITLDPLDVGAKLAQHIVRFRRGLAQLFPLESSDLWDIAFEDEFL